MSYTQAQANGVMKYRTNVCPAAPERLIDGGTITQGLNLSPGANNIGILTYDFNLWPYLYVNIYLRMTGTVSTTTSNVSATTLVPVALQYNLMQNIQLTMNGSDNFQTWTGQALHTWNLICGKYRNNEAAGMDVPITVKPVSGVAQSFDFTWVLMFDIPIFYPRLFSPLNAYQNHNTTSFELRLNVGSVAAFTNDANATMTVNPIQVSQDVLDFTILSNYGEPYVRETTFPRFETRQLRSNAMVATGVNQRVRLDRGLNYLGLLLGDFNTTNTALTPENITQMTVSRNNTDDWINNVSIQAIQRQVADLGFQSLMGSQQQGYYLVPLAKHFEMSQLIQTLGMTDWDLFLNTTGAGNVEVTELLYNIPTNIAQKQPNATIKKAGTSY